MKTEIDRVTVRFSTHEIQAINECAIQNGETFAGAIRYMINEYIAHEKRKSSDHEDLKALEKRLSDFEKALLNTPSQGVVDAQSEAILTLANAVKDNEKRIEDLQKQVAQVRKVDSSEANTLFFGRTPKKKRMKNTIVAS